jgi:CyaY protein
MDRQEFLRRADQALERVAQSLEDVDPDVVDFAMSDGVLTLEFADRQRYVLNRQTAADQMWFAAGARAWHYDWDAQREQWLDDRDGHELFARVREEIAKKLAKSV